MTAKSTYVKFDASVELHPAYRALGASWRRSLLAENRAAKTIEGYLEAHRRFGLFLAQRKLPQLPRAITREHVELWLVDMFEQHYKPASVSNRYRALQQWFKWLELEDEIRADPTARMRGPQVPESLPPVLAEDQVTRLLKLVEKARDFTGRRDYAMLMLLFDTGMRRSGLASIETQLVDLDDRIVVVHEKFQRDRVVAFGVMTARVIDRYLRARASHRYAGHARLFVGPRGPITGDGVYQIVTKRAAQAGLSGIHPHLFRHTYAHLFLEAGGQESDLMEQAGWRSPQMVRHYGAALRAQRAREAAKRLSPADRLER